jgi:two-component system sensor histidine kinase QseC
MVVATDAHGVLLSVDDSGPGLSPEALARLGERFFRVLGSDQPGSGLGWSVVRRLVEVFGAQIDAAPSTQLGGLAVTVRWNTRAS